MKKRIPPFSRARVKLALPIETPLGKTIWIGLGPLLAAGALVGLFWRTLPPEVPIFYSRPWGQDQLGPPSFLFMPLLLSLVFMVANLWIAKILDKSFIKQALLLGAITVAILSSVSVIRIIFLIS